MTQGLRHGFERRLGRPSTPAETVLRMIALRALRNWTWERLVWEVQGNVVYRRFCRIDGASVPDDKTLVKLNKLLGQHTSIEIVAGDGAPPGE